MQWSWLARRRGSWARRIARQIGIGKALRLLVFLPVGLARKSISEGGPIGQWRTRNGRREMERAAYELPPVKSKPHAGEQFSVHFLTGTRFWYQTLFCFCSLAHNCPVRLVPYFYDDGTLKPEEAEVFRRVVPWCEIVSSAHIERELDAALPRSEFPTIRAIRDTYPHIKKLTDIHAGKVGWRLVMDSDVLFFKSPEQLLEWYEAPLRPMVMQEVPSAYGYSEELLERISGGYLVPGVNVGICALRSEKIDWGTLERWCSTLIREEGPNYLLEQALSAVLVSKADAVLLPAGQYIVCPRAKAGQKPIGISHHYTSFSKRFYFESGWQHVRQQLMAPLGGHG